MTGLEMKYFVLKPGGNTAYHEASRHAMRVYANHIRKENLQLANEVQEWAEKEWLKHKAEPNFKPTS